MGSKTGARQSGRHKNDGSRFADEGYVRDQITIMIVFISGCVDGQFHDKRRVLFPKSLVDKIPAIPSTAMFRARMLQDT